MKGFKKYDVMYKKTRVCSMQVEARSAEEAKVVSDNFVTGSYAFHREYDTYIEYIRTDEAGQFQKDLIEQEDTDDEDLEMSKGITRVIYKGWGKDI